METWIEELSSAACRHHLATTTLGRLGLVIEGRPAIFPVNHVFDEKTGTIAFPSNHGRKFRAAVEGTAVAFEVDGVDDSGVSAWSVVAVGWAEEITDQEQMNRLAKRRSVLWRVDERTRWLRILPDELTGRRISTIPASAVPPA